MCSGGGRRGPTSAAHRPQLGQREFEADREHQEHHAEFGQPVGGGAVVGQLQRMRADQHADGQVTQHRRQVKHPESNHAKNCAAQ
jgi:hypothetical protein